MHVIVINMGPNSLKKCAPNYAKLNIDDVVLHIGISSENYLFMHGVVCFFVFLLLLFFLGGGEYPFATAIMCDAKCKLTYHEQ